MNVCLHCGSPVKNKFCNTSCQNKYSNTNRNNKKYGNFIFFKVSCHKCGVKFIVKEREKLHPQKNKYYCSLSCGNSRERSLETKKKFQLVRENLAMLTVNTAANVLEERENLNFVVVDHARPIIP